MSIQTHDIPTVVMVDNLSQDDKDISTSVIYDINKDGIEEIFIDFSLYNIDFYLDNDTVVEFLTLNLKTSFFNVINEIVYSGPFVIDNDDIIIKLWLIFKKELQINIENSLFFNSYSNITINDTTINFRINIGVIPAVYDTEVEMYISGVKYYNYISDIYCSTATISGIDVDVKQGPGSIFSLYTDLYACSLEIPVFETCIYNSIMSSGSINTDLSVISGSLVGVCGDVFSTVLNISGITTDIKTRSLFTGDFFLNCDKFTTASSIAWVDIVDYLYSVNIDNTNLYIDDTLASGIYFEDIPNGKRMYYDPTDDFYSDGVITYSIHAENSIGEVEEKDFYLLYGYDLQLNEVVNWGYDNKVVVRLAAQNLVFCPNFESVAFDFITKPLRSFNLGGIINSIQYENLSAKIFPQSTTFFYGQTYTVKIKGVKDFSGNVMEDFEYTFTLEDPLL